MRQNDERSTAAETVGPRGGGSAYIERRVEVGNRLRYSKREVEVDNDVSWGSTSIMDEGGAADDGGGRAVDFPRLVDGGVGEEEPPPSLLRLPSAATIVATD